LAVAYGIAWLRFSFFYHLENMKLLLGSEIERAFCLFYGYAPYGMRVYHGGSDIAVAKQLLNRADVVVGLKQMAGETYAPMRAWGCQPFLLLPCLEE
jgi:hypothetical protein